MMSVMLPSVEYLHSMSCSCLLPLYVGSSLSLPSGPIMYPIARMMSGLWWVGLYCAGRMYSGMMWGGLCDRMLILLKALLFWLCNWWECGGGSVLCRGYVVAEVRDRSLS